MPVVGMVVATEIEKGVGMWVGTEIGIEIEIEIGIVAATEIGIGIGKGIGMVVGTERGVVLGMAATTRTALWTEAVAAAGDRYKEETTRAATRGLAVPTASLSTITRINLRVGMETGTAETAAGIVVEIGITVSIVAVEEVITTCAEKSLSKAVALRLRAGCFHDLKDNEGCWVKHKRLSCWNRRLKAKNSCSSTT